MRALLVALLLTLPLAAAQEEHAHGGGNGAAMVLRDGPPDGRAVVGGYTHFGFALLDKDAAPLPHQNAQLVVTQGDDVLFSSTDTHEYDGLFSLDLRFTRPGPYQVTAMSGDMEMGVFQGEAVLPVNESVAGVQLTQRGNAFELSIVDANGALLEHTDAVVELRTVAGDALHSRTRLHIHDAPIAFSQALTPGEFVAQVVAYKAFATGRGADVRAVFAELPVTAPAAPEGLGAPPLPTPAPPMPLEPRGAAASADGLTLRTMYDPNNQVGIGQLARVVGVVTQDANHTTLQHVDFDVALSGPAGPVFSTQSAHEYDGVFEYVLRPAVPGVYKGTITATYGETVLETPVELLAVPPAVPLLGGTGAITLGLDGVEGIVAGTPANLTFSAMGASGPAMHSEVDVTIYHSAAASDASRAGASEALAKAAGDAEPPLYQFKLHTHDSGLTNAVVTFPHDGPWKVRVDPLPTLPEASVYTSAVFDVDVAKGIEETLPSVEGSKLPAAPVPAWGTALALVALAGVAALARRR